MASALMNSSHVHRGRTIPLIGATIDRVFVYTPRAVQTALLDMRTPSVSGRVRPEEEARLIMTAGTCTAYRPAKKCKIKSAFGTECRQRTAGIVPRPIGISEICLEQISHVEFQANSQGVES